MNSVMFTYLFHWKGGKKYDIFMGPVSKQAVNYMGGLELQRSKCFCGLHTTIRILLHVREMENASN